MTDLLSRAIGIAISVHANQKDKAEEPYILHPLRLMVKMETENERIVAVLHDAVEDSHNQDATLEAIFSVFHPEICDALDALTRKDQEKYRDFIVRVGNNVLAKKIKIADLEDNLNTIRLERIVEKDLKRIKKYHDSIRYLLSL